MTSTLKETLTSGSVCVLLVRNVWQTAESSLRNELDQVYSSNLCLFVQMQTCRLNHEIFLSGLLRQSYQYRAERTDLCLSSHTGSSLDLWLVISSNKPPHRPFEDVVCREDCAWTPCQPLMVKGIKVNLIIGALGAAAHIRALHSSDWVALMRGFTYTHSSD